MTKPPKPRPATLADLAALSALALRSKAHWGYDAAFLGACRAELTLTPETLQTHDVWMVEAQRQPIGFYSLGDLGGAEADLVHLFVAPEAIGTGVGQALWAHAVARARAQGYASLRIESDPYAEAFYRKMGAERVGWSTSSVQPGRSLPLLTFSLERPRASSALPQ